MAKSYSCSIKKKLNTRSKKMEAAKGKMVTGGIRE